MAQFDIHRNPGNRDYPYLLDLQADLLRDLATRIVAPLVPGRSVEPVAILNPTIAIKGKPYVVLLQEAAAVPRTALGRVEATAVDRRDELIAALDLLFTGI